MSNPRKRKAPDDDSLQSGRALVRMASPAASSGAGAGSQQESSSQMAVEEPLFQCKVDSTEVLTVLLNTLLIEKDQVLSDRVTSRLPGVRILIPVRGCVA